MAKTQSIGQKVGDWWEKRSTGEKVGIAAVSGIILYNVLADDGPPNSSGGTTGLAGNLSINWNNVTRSQNQLKIDADLIEEAVWGTGVVIAPTEDDTAIGNILKQMRTDDDVYALIQFYGHRGYGIVAESLPNLVQTIGNYLDQDIKDEVNEIYSRRGMTSQWL